MTTQQALATLLRHCSDNCTSIECRECCFQWEKDHLEALLTEEESSDKVSKETSSSRG